MLLKRAARGQLPLAAAFAGAVEEDPSGSLARAKKITLLAFGAAHEKFSSALPEQQEVVMHLADMLVDVFAIESAALRSEKLAGKSAHAAAMSAVFAQDALARIEIAARNVLAGCLDGQALRSALAVLQKLASWEPGDSIALRRNIAARLLDRERYAV